MTVFGIITYMYMYMHMHMYMYMYTVYMYVYDYYDCYVERYNSSHNKCLPYRILFQHATTSKLQAFWGQPQKPPARSNIRGPKFKTFHRRGYPRSLPPPRSSVLCMINSLHSLTNNPVRNPAINTFCTRSLTIKYH